MKPTTFKIAIIGALISIPVLAEKSDDEIYKFIGVVHVRESGACQDRYELPTPQGTFALAKKSTVALASVSSMKWSTTEITLSGSEPYSGRIPPIVAHFIAAIKPLSSEGDLEQQIKEVELAKHQLIEITRSISDCSTVSFE